MLLELEIAATVPDAAGGEKVRRWPRPRPLPGEVVCVDTVGLVLAVEPHAVKSIPATATILTSRILFGDNLYLLYSLRSASIGDSLDARVAG